jgi:hypothetical protein
MSVHHFAGLFCIRAGGSRHGELKMSSIRVPAIVVVGLLSALGIKLISDGVDLLGESHNGGLARIALAFIVFAVAVPIFLIVVLGWAHP